jgi:pimeloyl-ACP methyl ester carboxylesterase
LLGYIKILQDSKHSVLIYDYRGFGSSEGKPDLTSTVSDGEAAYSYLVDGRGANPEDIILMGRTVGAHVACELSSKHRCKAIVLEEPWMNVKNFVDSHPMTIGSRMVPAWLYPGDAYDNSKFLKGEHPPLLIVGYAPSQQGPYDLYEQASMPKKYLQLMELDSFIFPNLPEQAQRYTSKLVSVTSTTTSAKAGAGATAATPAAALAAAAAKPAAALAPVASESKEPFKWQSDLKTAIADAKRLHMKLLTNRRFPHLRTMIHCKVIAVHRLILAPRTRESNLQIR